MRQGSRWRLLILAVILVSALAILGFLTLGPAWEEVPTPGGSYVEAVVGRPDFLNPLLAEGHSVDDDVDSLVYSGLTKLSPTGEVVPDLARDWEVSADGLSYTFRLRDGVTWHDGKPFGADDVLFTYQTLQSPDLAAPPELIAFWRDVKVDKVDDRQVRFTLKQPIAQFLEYASLGILPSHLLSGVSPKLLPEQGFNARPVGTGPYRVVEASWERVVLEQNPGYYGLKPYLSAIELRCYPDAGQALQAIRDGEVDGLRSVPSDKAAEIAAGDGPKLYTRTDSSNVTMLLLNDADGLFSDVRVRRALSVAIDRRKVIQAALGGQGVPAGGPVSPDSPAFASAVAQPALDRARAGDLLAQAGWTVASGERFRQRAGQPLEFVLLTNDQPERQRAAEEISRQLEEIGVRAIVQVAGWTGIVQDFLVPHRFQAVLTATYSAAADPDLYPFWHSSQASGGLNFGSWSSPAADQALAKARSDVRREDRLRDYADFQQAFAAEVPAVPLYSPTYTFAVASKVRGIGPSLFLRPADRFLTLGDWYTTTKRVPRPR